MRVNRREYLLEVRDKTGYTEDELRLILKAIREVLIAHIRNEDSILLFDGLLISGVRTPASKKRNPVGKICEIPEQIKIKCRPTKTLKDAVN